MSGIMTSCPWSRAQVVYEFLVRFVVSSEVDAKQAKAYVDQSLCLQLVELFDRSVVAVGGGAVVSPSSEFLQYSVTLRTVILSLVDFGVLLTDIANKRIR